MSSKTTRATRPRKPKATGPDLGNIMQPRNKREEAIIENVLEHAEEIRAARVRTVNRAIAISPHYSKEEKRAAQTKGDVKALRECLTRAQETAEKAISDGKRASFIDAEAIPSIARDLKRALARLDQEKESHTKPAPLTYEQIDSLARGIAIDLTQYEETAMPLMLLMRDIAEHGDENAETIANLLNGYLFMWQPEGDAAEEAHVEQYRRRFLAGELKGGQG
jgi:hypothetical protein